jgi:general secretion pathway protein L
MRLFIRITASSGGAGSHELVSLAWLLLDRSGELVSQGSGDLNMLERLVDLKTLQDPSDVVLLVPTEHCLSIRCTVPGRTAGQMRRALPYVVEEFVAGDIDAMHIASGPIRRGEPVDVVLIERAVLQSWLEGLAKHGLIAGYATADAALLASMQGQATLLFDDDRVLVRSVDQVAAIESDALKLVLESLAATADASGIRFVAVNGRVPELMRAEVSQATEHAVEWIDTESDVTVLAHLAAAFPGKPPAINLLQGTLSPPKQPSGAWSRWRGVAALIGIWLVVLVASEAVRGAWASHRAALLTEQIESRFKTYFPNERRIPGKDAYSQMSSRIGARGTSESTFLLLLGHLANGLAANPGAQLRSINFNDGRAELGAEVAVAGFEALETLKAAWTKEGVSVDVSSAEQQDQQVHARIRLKAG